MSSREEGLNGRLVIDVGSEGISSHVDVKTLKRQKDGKNEKHKEILAGEEDGGGSSQDSSGRREDDYTPWRRWRWRCRMLVHGDE